MVNYPVYDLLLGGNDYTVGSLVPVPAISKLISVPGSN
jgi:hypothetical protein